MNSKEVKTGQRLSDPASLPPAKNLELTLDVVGLENVQTQVRFEGHLLPARGQASVSLIDRQARGIHMSRLFKILNHMHEQDLSVTWMRESVAQMLHSHQELSDAAELTLSFELPVLRKALLSDEHGWRTYPVTYRVSERQGKQELSLAVRVLYSSTCPCSTGLSRQAMQERFRSDFSGRALDSQLVEQWLGQTDVAHPHSQRSEAIGEFILNPEKAPPSPLSLIDAMEKAIGTPVQAAVKRADEQEFARLNAQNLMFCEDAARKLKAALMDRSELVDFHIEVRHFESLHAHDVVAKVRRNT
jgi:GTP cyclohydrolase I